MDMEDHNPEASNECYDGVHSKPETELGLQLIKSYVSQLTPDLQKKQLEIRELVGKQTSLINSLHKENEEILFLLNEPEVQSMFASIKQCHGQLNELKKKLMFIHKKTLSLERRANILRVAKQREALQREHLKESMLVREEELISKQNEN